MKRSPLLTALLGLAAALPLPAIGQPSSAHLAVAGAKGGDVIATVRGRVRSCGITAIGDKPTFVVHGFVVDIHQATAGIACMNGATPTKPYRRSVNLGHLPPGRYTIHWSFPDLTANYVAGPR